MLQQALLYAWQPGRCRLLLSVASLSSHAPAGWSGSSASCTCDSRQQLGGSIVRGLTSTDASVPSCSRPQPLFPQNQRGACSSAAVGEAMSPEQHQRASVLTPAPSAGTSAATSTDPHFIQGGSAAAAASAATARLGFVRGGFSVADFPPELIRNFCIIAHVDHGEWGPSQRGLWGFGKLRGSRT